MVQYLFAMSSGICTSLILYEISSLLVTSHELITNTVYYTKPNIKCLIIVEIENNVVK